MTSIAVKCPVCGRVKVLRRRAEQKTFYCCALQHLIEKNLICEGVSLKKQKKEEKGIRQAPLVLDLNGEEVEVGA